MKQMGKIEIGFEDEIAVLNSLVRHDKSETSRHVDERRGKKVTHQKSAL
jgi:hypothetical protein